MGETSDKKGIYSALGVLERGLFVFVFFAACAVVFAYVRQFSINPPGQPEDWAHFGDYLGGVLNPIIGIITVLLIVLTLATTRKEASDSRAEMKAQLAHFEKQQVLTDMHRRLEGVIAEWNRLLSLPAPKLLVGSSEDGRPMFSSNYVVADIRALLESIRFRSMMQNYRLIHGIEGEFPNWGIELHPLISLLRELNRYLKEYEYKAGNYDLTDFYRRRVDQGVTQLSIAGAIDDNLMRDFDLRNAL